MSAGLRNQRFRFTSDAGTTNTTTGTHTEDWSDVVAERWARFAPASDASFTALRSNYGLAAFGLELSFDPLVVTLSPSNRAVWLTTSREFDILGVLDPDGGRRVVHIALAERFIQRSVTT